MKIYLCDDDAVQLEKFSQQVKALSCVGDTIQTCSTSAQLHTLLSDSPVGDTCVILDIELAQKGEGIALGKELNHLYPYLPIILCTAYQGYASDIWHVDHCTFLTKPVQKDALQAALAKARGLLTARFLTVSTPDGYLQIQQKEIQYIERRLRDSYLYVTFRDMPISAKENLEVLVQRLNSNQFFKIHRSYLVNLAHIIRIHDTEVSLRNVGITLTASRSKQKGLLEALANYEGRLSRGSD